MRSHKPVAGYIYTYPEKKTYEYGHDFDLQQDILKIGDLHGNPIKLLHILISYGVVDVDEDVLEVSDTKESVYSRLVTNYFEITELLNSEAAALNEDHYTRLVFLMAQIQHVFSTQLIFNARSPHIRLYGDMLADRGPYDELTLSLLQNIYYGGCAYTILLSNHDISFIMTQQSVFKPFLVGEISAAEVAKPENYLRVLSHGMSASLLNVAKIQQLIQRVDQKNGGLSRDLMGNIVYMSDKSYMPFLKLMDYEYDPAVPRLTLAMHAPGGLQRLSDVAAALGVHYDGEELSVVKITNAIDSINAEFVDPYSGDLNVLTLEKISESTAYYHQYVKRVAIEKQKIDFLIIKLSSMISEKEKYASGSKEFIEISVACQQYEKELAEKKVLVTKLASNFSPVKAALHRLMWHRVSDNADHKYDITDMRESFIDPSGRIVYMQYDSGHDTPDHSLSYVLKLDNQSGKVAPKNELHQYFDLTELDPVGHAEVHAITSDLWKEMQEKDSASMQKIQKEIDKLADKLGSPADAFSFRFHVPLTRSFADWIKEIKESISNDIKLVELKIELNAELAALEKSHAGLITPQEGVENEPPSSSHQSRRHTL